MGIKLTELVPRKEITWEQLNNKILAIDSSNIIFQFLSSIRQRDGTPLTDSNGNVTSHLVGLFSRTINLLTKNIKPVFVFDGKSPKLKKQEQELRRAAKEKAKEKYQEAVTLGDENLMLKYAKQATTFTKENIEECKQLIKALGLPIVQAPSEGEAQASYMVKKNDAWAVASQDYDCLLYKTPRLIQNLTLSEKRKLASGLTVKITPQLIELRKVLGHLEIDHDQLIILAILIGTDFNPKGIKGIGPKKALHLVQSDKSFEQIFSELQYDFDWKEIFHLIKNMPTTDKYDLKFNDINKEAIMKLLVDKHDFSEERIDSALNKIKDTPKQSSLASWLGK